MSELIELRKQAANCTACELYAGVNRMAFGAGRQGASIVLGGEQSGTRRIAGAAARGLAALDRAPHRAGVSREDAYVTSESGSH